VATSHAKSSLEFIDCQWEHVGMEDYIMLFYKLVQIMGATISQEKMNCGHIV